MDVWVWVCVGVEREGGGGGMGSLRLRLEMGLQRRLNAKWRFGFKLGVPPMLQTLHAFFVFLLQLGEAGGGGIFVSAAGGAGFFHPWSLLAGFLSLGVRVVG